MIDSKKDCPFCKKHTVTSFDTGSAPDAPYGEYLWYVVCHVCSMRGPMAKTIEEATDKWNEIGRANSGKTRKYLITLRATDGSRHEDSKALVSTIYTGPPLNTSEALEIFYTRMLEEINAGEAAEKGIIFTQIFILFMKDLGE